MHSPGSNLSPNQILKQIRGAFSLDEEKVRLLSIETDTMVRQHTGLLPISDLTFLQEIDHSKKHLIKRAGFISPKVLFLSEKIKSLCYLKYRHADRRIDPCGGIKKNYLACSPYSPNEAEIRKLFSRADLFCFFQAGGLTDMKQQKYLHEILFEVEDFLRRMGMQLVMSFGAGPCRMCEQCAGQVDEECYEPDKMRFSLEACGIDVDWAMKMMGLKYKDKSWEINWLEEFALKEQEQFPFKSAFGFLVKSRR